MVDLLDDSLLVDRYSAEGAQLELGLVGVMSDEVIIACLMELVSIVTSKLNNVFAHLHRQEADTALSSCLDAERGVDGTTKPRLRPVKHRLAGWLSFGGALADRLSTNEGQPAIVLKLVTSNRMVLEVVEATKFICHEIKAEDTVLELRIVVNIHALVTTAGEDGVEEENGEAADDEDWMLQEVDDEVHVQISVTSIQVSWLDFEIFFPSIALILDEVDGVADDATLDQPLDECPWGEAPVTAGLHEEAVAEEVVECVKYTESEGDTSHLGQEAQVDHEVVVEQVP